MTTPVEKTKRTRSVKREYNELGKFFAILRINLGLTAAEWAKKLGVSQLAISNVERGNKKMSFDFAVKVAEFLYEEAPIFAGEFTAIVANQLGVLLIPPVASPEAVEEAYMTLLHYDAHMAQVGTAQTSEVGSVGQSTQA